MTNLTSSLAATRTRSIAYWATTMTIAAELAVRGVWDIVRTDYVREIVVQQLGYPTYFLVIMGVWKLPGAVVLLAPRLLRLKEWAYAGAVFTYTERPPPTWRWGRHRHVRPGGFAAVALASSALRPPARRDLAPTSGPGLAVGARYSAAARAS